MPNQLIIACLLAAIFHPILLQIHSVIDKSLFKAWADKPIAREIAAGFSHELKSPLAGLSLRAEMTLAELDRVGTGGKSLQRALPKIKQELSYILNQALDAARRIEAVRGVAEPPEGQTESVSVARVIDSALLASRPKLAASKIQVKRLVAEDLPDVQSNPQQLEIVFLNLIKNAIESMDGPSTASTRRKTLTIQAAESEGRVTVTFSDQGPGIPAAQLPHLFEPYHTTKGKRGTGMGLYLSQQIVKAHGGFLDLKRAAGKGCEFVVSLLSYSRNQA